MRLAETGTVPIGKVALDWPAGTLSVAGTVTELLEEERVTASPVAGAGELSVTVAEAEVPPTKDVGVTKRATG